MNIAIDWDGTFTAAPTLFHDIAALIELSGNVAFVVTLRRPSEPIESPLPVYYTSRRGKKEFMRDIGIAVDVWIDDNPAFICWGPED